MKHWIIPALMLILTVPPGAPARADDDSGRAREAVQQGKIVPLRDVLARVESSFQGEVIEVELEEKDGGDRLIYEIKLLTPQGNLLKLIYDAQTMELLKTKGRGLDAAKRR